MIQDMKQEYYWPVVPLCERQLRDVSKEDVLQGGLYRKCNTYKSGGGYDKLPAILAARNIPSGGNQFVVQLHGCPLKCPYCYVTPDGIEGKHTAISSTQLIADFHRSGQEIFHLMGGAPGLYLIHWHELISQLPEKIVFHSDLLLCETTYRDSWLASIRAPNAIYAVSIKGWDEASFEKNTGVPANVSLMQKNIKRLQHNRINCYLTFTGMSEEQAEQAKVWLQIPKSLDCDSFIIPLKEYDALRD